MKMPQFDPSKRHKKQTLKQEEKVNTTPELNIDEWLLRPKVMLLRVILIPFLSIIGFTIYTFLRGFGGTRYESTNPAAVTLGFPLWLVLVLALILFISINIIIKVCLKSNIVERGGIVISNEKLIIDRYTYVMSFEINQSQEYSISISRLWGLLFQKFYRIGKVKIRYQNDSYWFLFTIKDMELEEIIRKQKFFK